MHIPERGCCNSLEYACKCVGSGWKPLVEKAWKTLEDSGADFTVDQVKEKFGGLRFYFSLRHDQTIKADRVGMFDALYHRISAIERESYRTCESCGEPGKLRSDLHWIQTLCDQHYKEEVCRRGSRKSSTSP